MRNKQVVGNRPLLPGETHIKQGIRINQEETRTLVRLVIITLAVAFIAMWAWNKVYIQPHDRLMDKTFGSQTVNN